MSDHEQEARERVAWQAADNLSDSALDLAQVISAHDRSGIQTVWERIEDELATIREYIEGLD